MDQRLSRGASGLVRRHIAEAWLASPTVDAPLGNVRLKSHQVEAASRLLSLLRAHGGAMLADATGMGKTYVAIAIARVTGNAAIVVPAALRTMWHESLGIAEVKASVVTYEGLSRGEGRLSECPGLLVLDEAHHARNPSSRRYARIADLAWGAQVLLLSATPVHNRRRDLRALMALFLGSRSYEMSDDELRLLIVRRTSAQGGAPRLPGMAAPEWLDVPHDGGMMRAIMSIPVAVPAADGVAAHALMVLGLIRAWASSEAALRATLRRRLRRVASFTVALESGRVPNRRELADWPVVDDAIQLGFPELLLNGRSAVDLSRVRDALVRHGEGVRCVLQSLERSDGVVDRRRAALLTGICSRHEQIPVVAFSQFADTANELFRASAPRGGVALVTGKGARIASGRVATDEIVRGFDEGQRTASAMPLGLLIATDVLSEGLSLRRAGVVVHLDVPWTLARLEQRVGRLRRMGSPHRSIAVYAIGPPVESRELTAVLRALQRKARLTSGAIEADELGTSLPLFGDRMTRATAGISRRRTTGDVERVRNALGAWLQDVQDVGGVARADPFALALVSDGLNCRLVVVDGGGVSEDTGKVVNAVQALSGKLVEASGDSIDSMLIAKFDAWLDAERGRELAGLGTDSPSGAHVAVLRALQARLAGAARAERPVLAARIERCRGLVLAARGIGAELAIAQIAREGLQFEALELLLAARTIVQPSAEGETRIVGLIESVPGNPRAVRAFVAESMHPVDCDLPVSSYATQGMDDCRGHSGDSR